VSEKPSKNFRAKKPRLLGLCGHDLEKTPINSNENTKVEKSVGGEVDDYSLNSWEDFFSCEENEEFGEDTRATIPAPANPYITECALCGKNRGICEHRNVLPLEKAVIEYCEIIFEIAPNKKYKIQK